AHQLTLRSPSDSMENLSRSFSGAKVDLNPHQVDAALFAFRSPLSKGVILADEVGLGKTIEAGLVISQKWAERKRRILLILPATLRGQWQAELEEKFFLPSVVLDSKSFKQLQKEGHHHPFDQATKGEERVVICSYHFAALKAREIREVPWDLVVMDEAHRLRNVYKTSSKIASSIAEATKGCRKLLLTATPLQNSLLELFGLVSLIDDRVFGDLDSFKGQFLKNSHEEMRNRTLRDRLGPLCTRTLRKQVLEYIRYTQRIPITQDFTPSDEEQLLYENISAYLRRPELLALPNSQRALITMVLRKLMASSSFAIAGALKGMANRLEDQQASLEADFELLEELADEWDPEDGAQKDIDPAKLGAELADLQAYTHLAESIQNNAKGEALLKGLQMAFEKAQGLGAARKAVIFTESRRTQAYLLDLLNEHGYAGQIVTLNGQNSEFLARDIYQRWKQRHAGQDILKGSQAVNMKTALVEEFRDHATILLATEAAAEGVNLQFCSLVVNYDLPWNPQRVEQRIGRCHRYGQEHDVVVVNFLNRANEADQRVFQLLSQKFRLFEGVFGASDEVLGSLESGVDLEKRIAQVYQDCRTPKEIKEAFDALQGELEEQIQARMTETRTALLENFDEEVAAKLRVRRDKAQEALDHRRSLLWRLTRTELDGKARFHGEEPRFEVMEGADQGHYHMLWPQADEVGATFYREEHPLASRLLQQTLGRILTPSRLVMESDHQKSSVLEAFKGTSGQLCLAKLRVDSVETEEFLMLAARTEDGRDLDPEQCEKMMGLTARMEPSATAATRADWQPAFADQVRQHLGEVERRNTTYFEEESAKLDAWAEDLKLSLERELADLGRQIRDAKAAKKIATSLQEKLDGEKAVKALEARRNKLRRDLYEQQDQIDARRGELIAEIEGQLKTQHVLEKLFVIQWELT
ncbi:MAG: DEAD/DEAH box helicase, partial [Bdellovibrionales bacterium]|nr:DEAD/DEAH box helicase [Bdellovibrionales bacterium]